MDRVVTVSRTGEQTETHAPSTRDRRDYTSRGQTAKRVIEALLAEPGGIPAEAVAYDVSVSVARRILQRLAIRGLVAVRGTKWEPRPVLFLGRAVSLERTGE